MTIATYVELDVQTFLSCKMVPFKVMKYNNYSPKKKICSYTVMFPFVCYFPTMHLVNKKKLLLLHTRNGFLDSHVS